MKRLLLLPLLALPLSCLTGIVRWTVLERSSPEPELSIHCPLYSRGILESPPQWKENWALPLVTGALLADTAIIYALSVQNGWYGFLYFGLSYPLIGAERFPMEPFAFGSWCGSPDAPMEPPADYYYAQGNAPPEECKSSDENFQSLLVQAGSDLIVYQSGPLKTLRDDDQIDYFVRPVGNPPICVHVLHVMGGEKALKAKIKSL